MKRNMGVGPHLSLPPHVPHIASPIVSTHQTSAFGQGAGKGGFPYQAPAHAHNPCWATVDGLHPTTTHPAPVPTTGGGWICMWSVAVCAFTSEYLHRTMQNVHGTKEVTPGGYFSSVLGP